MCGVCGVISLSDSLASSDMQVLDHINAAQGHRGPDDRRVWQGDFGALGHTRLAIIDLGHGGEQPFETDDGAVKVVFNGEIYNHEELRARHGLEHLARCDGAVIPALWSRLGTAMFRELRGMYSIAIYEPRTDLLTLARDPFGVKPLYWAKWSDRMAFASEVRPLAEALGKVSLNTISLIRYLSYGAMAQDGSPFDETRSVPSNSWQQFRKGVKVDEGVVFQHPLEASPVDQGPTLREAFIESVGLHLASDVPTALLLSSGLDSSAIAWAACELGHRLSCVTVELGGGRSEATGARSVAARFGHRHDVVAEAPDAESIDRFFDHMQRPTVDGLNTFLVCHAINRHGIKVALSGLGADEMLAGYHSFRRLRYLRALQIADKWRLTPIAAGVLGKGRPYAVARKAGLLVSPDGPRNAESLGHLYRRVFLPDEVAALLPGHCAPLATSDSDDITALALSKTDIQTYLCSMLLPDADAYSMASSLELRVPFVDIPFARTALAENVKEGVGKIGFAEALGHPLLTEIAGTRKQGFTLPMDRWMRTAPLAVHVARTLEPTAPIRHFLAESTVDECLGLWQQGRSSWSKTWTLVALNSWLSAVESSVTVDYEVD